jgi:hypothetical protein
VALPDSVFPMQHSDSKPLPFQIAVATLVRWAESCSQNRDAGDNGPRARRARVAVDPGLVTPLDWLRAQSARQQVRDLSRKLSLGMSRPLL